MSNAVIASNADAIFDAFFAAGMADAAKFMLDADSIAVDCSVLVDRDVRLAGYESRVANRAVAITCRIADTGVPERGSVFVVGAERFVVDSIEEQREDVAVCLVLAEGAP